MYFSISVHIHIYSTDDILHQGKFIHVPSLDISTYLLSIDPKYFHNY